MIFTKPRLDAIINSNEHDVLEPVSFDFSRKHRAKAVPPKSNRFMAYVAAAFVHKVLNVQKRKRKPDVYHNSKMDLSRFSAAPSARLGHLSFESDRAFPAQC